MNIEERLKNIEHAFFVYVTLTQDLLPPSVNDDIQDLMINYYETFKEGPPVGFINPPNNQEEYK